MRFLDLFKALEEFVIMLKMPGNIYEYSDSEDEENEDESTESEDQNDQE